MLKVPNLHATDILAALVADTTGLWDGAKVKLYQNDFNPAADTELADLTEADFGGYAEQAVTWGEPYVDSNDKPSVAAASVQFNRGATGDDNLVYGYYVVNAAEDKLLWAERYEEPVNMSTNTDAILVLPVFSFGNAEE